MRKSVSFNDGGGLYDSRHSASSINTSQKSFNHHTNHHTDTTNSIWRNECDSHRHGVYNKDYYENTLSYGRYYRISPFDHDSYASSWASQDQSPNKKNGSLDVQILEELDAAITHKPNKIIVNCDKCGSGFTSRGNLNRHDRTKHRRERVYCPFRYCTKSFSQKSDLKRHNNRVHQK